MSGKDQIDCCICWTPVTAENPGVVVGTGEAFHEGCMGDGPTTLEDFA